jgi:EAL domain-containing protein (putative c-di-GMP-specific phosphodiesterase class I)
MDNVAIALYHAKVQGRGCSRYFADELTQTVRERLTLEVRLWRAIEKQQLRVYFQPQLDINSGQIIGAEALVRWIDPIHGFITPNRFIPIAEETGLIIAIGEWVLRETCRLGQQWLNAGLPPITLAVNVSPYQFKRSDINALVTQILDETGYPVHLLELEITESGLMDNQQATAILNDLHTQGVHLAIDDFGTGYSSLAYLKFFPLDVLKIDKSFIDDIPFLASDMAIASTIIAMAHHLGFKVLAEGVETQAQLDFLREHGCDMYQGYLYSKPLPAEDFAKLLLNPHSI